MLRERSVVAIAALLAALTPVRSRASMPPAPAPDAIVLSAGDSLALETIAAVVALFREKADAAWPGYDLGARPLLAYIPGRWAVVVNAPSSVEGFAPYPAAWPELGAPAQIREGPLGTLAGQLVFDLDMDGFRTAAVPLSAVASGDRRGGIGDGLAFTVHEMFHQYQRDAFRSIPNDLPDERYPMLASENTALASLEARILMDAVAATGGGDSLRARELAEEFVAVRRSRWDRDPSFLPTFERPQELMEGTAKYVEVRCVGLMGDLCRETAGAATRPPGYDVFADVTPEAYLLADFEDRLNDGVIEPSDMARNRMYPVASAIALLLDFFGMDWKGRVSDPATSPGLAEMLGEGLGVDAAATDSLVARAERRYDYDFMRALCDAQAQAYPLAYQAAVDSLMGLPGLHVSLETAVSGLRRSRSCSGKRWTLERPARSFSKACQAYALESVGAGELFVEIRESGIVEESSADGTSRRVSFVAQDVTSVEIDGHAVDLTANGTRPFGRLILAGPSFDIRYDGEGSLTVDGASVHARLLPGP